MGKVFIDWSQNNPAKTTIGPYSLRGRRFPTVAAPRDWSELEAATAGPALRQLDHTEVARRFGEDGDPLAELAATAGGPDAPRLPER